MHYPLGLRGGWDQAECMDNSCPQWWFAPGIPPYGEAHYCPLSFLFPKSSHKSVDSFALGLWCQERVILESTTGFPTHIILQSFEGKKHTVLYAWGEDFQGRIGMGQKDHSLYHHTLPPSTFLEDVLSITYPGASQNLCQDLKGCCIFLK